MRQLRTRITAGLAGLAAILASCGGSSSSMDEIEPADPCAPANLIWVYARILDPSSPAYPMAIFRLHDGSETRLTDDVAAEDAAVSPDGRRIVFQRGSVGDPESAGYQRHRLYVMNADGSEQQPLLDRAYEIPVRDDTLVSWDTRPVWSPDGSTIAFTRESTSTKPSSPDRYQGIMTVPADGGEPRQIADGQRLDDTAAAWSSDSSRLAWTTIRPHTVHWATRQGRKLGQLELPGATGAPSWSDGDREILVPYQRDPYGPRPGHGVYRVDLDTGQFTKIPLEQAWIDKLWSLPTGQLVAVETVRDDEGNDVGGRVVVMDSERPEDGEVIASFDSELYGLATAVPDTPDGWAACTKA